MMKKMWTNVLLGILMITALHAHHGSLEEITASLKMMNGVDLRVPFGDPFVMLHDGTYYAYGTYASDGIAVFESDDLYTWKIPESAANGLALHKDDSYGERWFWAPEIYYVDGTFYMYYSAAEHMCVATSDSPTGPFRQKEKIHMLEGERTIDNSLFIDDDGTPYLYFNRFNDGLNIWVARLKDNLMEIMPETMKQCIHVSQEWEEVWPRVNEGPFVTKHKGVYHMTYSANSYESPHYGIGVATGSHPMGPWTKYEDNPIWQMPGDLVGVGHSANFIDKEGNLRISFHAHNGKSNIHPRNMYIGTVNFVDINGEIKMTIEKEFITTRLIDADQLRR